MCFGLPAGPTDEELLAGMKNALGVEVRSWFVSRNKHEMPKLMGLRLEDAATARRAWEREHVEVLGAQVELRPRRRLPNPYGFAVEDDAIERTLFVSHISAKLTSTTARAHVEQLASEVGAIERVFIFFEREQPWVHTGSAVVTMATVEEAEAALMALHRHVLHGEPLKARPFEPRRPSERA